MCAIRAEFLNNIFMNVGIPFATQSPRPEVATVHVLDIIWRPDKYSFTSLPFFQASKTIWCVCFAGSHVNGEQKIAPQLPLVCISLTWVFKLYLFLRSVEAWWRSLYQTYRISFGGSVLEGRVLMLWKKGHGFVRQVSLRTLCRYGEVIVGVCFGECAYRISKASPQYTRSRFYWVIHVVRLCTVQKPCLMF
jgi:hypothetical protein